MFRRRQQQMKAAGAYERLVRPLLFSLDPETAHHLALRALRIASRLPFALAALHRFAPQSTPKTLFDLTFPNPIGLAAGFDKNGVAIPAWAALGFGFVEIGTVTAKAQPGNPRPRIFRYPEEEALINRLGFNNDGADVVAARLRQLRDSGRRPQIPVGINIGKSKVTPIDNAADDYLHSFRILREFADYIVLNVSSPNTPGLRSLQEHDALEQLLRAIRAENQTTRKPILLKIAPDLALSDLDQIIATCEANEIAGIIATNTTLDHTAIPPLFDQAGGLSGRPLGEKSTEIVRAINARSRLPVIASGGIFDAASAREKLAAGAQLLQVYTGYIYRGPGLLREIAGNL
jgi:dihydroorotate dehydrogenase